MKVMMKAATAKVCGWRWLTKEGGGDDDEC